jgi:resuscitation-promoting factor RpfB
MRVISKLKALSIGKQVVLGGSSLLVAGSFAASQVNSKPAALNLPTITPLATVTPVAPVITTENVSELEPIAFQSRRIKDPNLLAGNTKVIQAGVNGVTTLTYKVTKTDGKQTSKDSMQKVITTHPVDEIVAEGTKVAQPKCDPNYSDCVPIASDVDCSGGSGNGPAYVAGPVRVIGSDIYGLDRDGDGYGCE